MTLSRRLSTSDAATRSDTKVDDDDDDEELKWTPVFQSSYTTTDHVAVRPAARLSGTRRSTAAPSRRR